MSDQLNLFRNGDSTHPAFAPLAERMRPRSLDEFVGQSHLTGEGKILHRLIHEGPFQSLIFWGPPGCGKTTLARLIARRGDANLVSLSAVTAGTREIRAAVDEALAAWSRSRKRTWLFMDEIHRLNKAQQDALLPHVEKGTVTLLGATTENPSFEIIRPLLSRSRVLVLEPLAPEELRAIVRRTLEDRERGLGDFPAEMDDNAWALLLEGSGGDARVALNALELAVLTTPPDSGGVRRVDGDAMREALQRSAVHYDKAGEEHFNLISALHKSLRGSDPDAGLYWLARMLEAGEDPMYIARRIVRAASEDVGLADPFALVQALSAQQAYQFLGSPEGDLALAQAVVYVALAPKSNSLYTAYKAARDTARRTGAVPVPFHLRNAPTSLMKRLGYARDYQYPHDSPEGWVPERYLPEPVGNEVFYTPKPWGWEGKWRELLEKRRRIVRGGGNRKQTARDHIEDQPVES